MTPTQAPSARTAAEELARFIRDAREMVEHYPHDRLKFTGAEFLALVGAAHASGRAEGLRDAEKIADEMLSPLAASLMGAALRQKARALAPSEEA
jgi:hypothetical protein